MRLWRLLPTLVLVACGARTALSGEIGVDDEPIPTRDAGRPVDARLPDPPPDAICIDTPGDVRSDDCAATLQVTDLRLSSDSCFVDTEIVEGAVGELRWDCKGGDAVATFGAATFRGTFDQDLTRIAACTGTSFDFSDGCTWNSAQRITGMLGAPSLQFDYAERPAAGQRGCSSPCTASATLRVLP